MQLDCQRGSELMVEIITIYNKAISVILSILHMIGYHDISIASIAAT